MGTPRFGEWQPIETAPRDGTNILLFTMHDGENGLVVVGYWDEDESGWRAPGEWKHTINCDLWMPLPAKPRVSWSYTLNA